MHASTPSLSAGLLSALFLAAAPLEAQRINDIPDVEIPDVRIGENDAVIHEEPEPPPVAVFEAPLEEEEPLLEEAPSVTEGERVTGNITAIDLEDGTLEVDTDTRGSMRLTADRAILRQVAPGQSVSLSYVDRADGRWVDALETLPSPTTER